MVKGVLLEPPKKLWTCPACTQTAVTQEARPHTRMHTCAGMKGLTVPMVPDGTRARLVAVEREDYIGSETVQTDDDGRPIMAVNTIRDDGQDCTVYAPVATVVIAKAGLADGMD